MSNNNNDIDNSDNNNNNNNNNEKKEWIPIYEKRLPDAINYAKGKQSMAEFARKCGLNPMTLSRAVNSSIKKPLDEKTIRVMAECSDLPTEDVLARLMYANGWERNNTEEKRQRAQQNAREKKERRESVQNIIMRTLFEDGYTISPVFNTDLEYLDPVLKRCGFPLCTPVRFALSVQGHDLSFWNFTDNIFTGIEFEANKKQYKMELEDELFFLMTDMKDVFLRDMWEPQAFEDSLYSIVFVNKDLFDAFIKTLKDVKFNNSFSLILLDLDKQQVVEERFLPRHDGQVYESLFKNTKQR